MLQQLLEKLKNMPGGTRTPPTQPTIATHPPQNPQTRARVAVPTDLIRKLSEVMHKRTGRDYSIKIYELCSSTEANLRICMEIYEALELRDAKRLPKIAPHEFDEILKYVKEELER